MDEIILKALVVNFTGGFFLALACLMFYWDKGMRELALLLEEKLELIRPVMKNRFALFAGIFAVGFPAMMVFMAQQYWRLIRDK